MSELPVLSQIVQLLIILGEVYAFDTFLCNSGVIYTYFYRESTKAHREYISYVNSDQNCFPANNPEKTRAMKQCSWLGWGGGGGGDNVLMYLL